MKALLWVGALSGLLSGCLNATDLGSVPALEGGVEDPRLAALRERVLGRWCGVASVPDVVEQEIELDFSEDTYRVSCGCTFPFPSEQALDGESSRYRINEVTLSGEGWGRAEQVVVGGTSQTRLEHIVLEGDSLRFERRAERAARRVFVSLTRCD